MGRQDRPLDESSGPLHVFAAELRVLREKAGNPTYLKMARTSGKSRTALSEAAGGDHLPTWATVEAYVLACDGNPLLWEPRWEALRTAVREPVADAAPSAPVAVPSPAVAGPAVSSPVPSGPVATDGPGCGRWPALRTGVGVLLAAAAVLLVVGGGFAVTLLHRGTAQAAVRSEPVTVQNKIAYGATDLGEDRTPAYLSTRTLAFCKPNGCAVPGTDVLSGAVLRATCWTEGEMMVNYAVADPQIATNTNRVRSGRWYGVALGSGGTGYISEVYLAPGSRGGLGLPAC